MNSVTNVLSSHLQRYQMKERLGSGGMATVYRAEDVNLKRDVAIKVLHEHLVYEEGFKERFEQEARTIASLNHPSIVQIYDFDVIDIDNRLIYYMVMPYLSTDTLVDVLNDCRMKEQTLPHERVLAIMTNLCSALRYAHERDMVHRDVKPANILFDENDLAILTDFGIARLAQKSGLTQDGVIIGTPAYMSPEQAMGQTVDHRSDIYALGIILYEMLTGRPPFEDDGTVSVLLKHAKEDPPPVTEFMEIKNKDFDAIMDRVLHKDSQARYQNAVDLCDDLKAAIENESITARVKPATMPRRPVAPQPETQVLHDLPDTNATRSLTQTLQTVVLRPARQNPLGAIALVIALVSLLIITRVIQFGTSTPPASITTTPLTVTGADSVDSMTMDNFYFDMEFTADDTYNRYWQQSVGTASRQIQDDLYVLSNSSPSVAMTSLVNPEYTYDNVNITLTGRLRESSANPSSGYGIVFRYQDADNYNVFAVDGERRYSIWVREDGEWLELRAGDDDWSFAPTVNPIGELNTLNLNVYNNTLTAYVNGVRVVELMDDTLGEGAIGVYMATTRDGEATVDIDRYAVSEGMDLDSSMTGESDSMTGETDSMTDDTDSMTGE